MGIGRRKKKKEAIFWEWMGIFWEWMFYFLEMNLRIFPNFFVNPTSKFSFKKYFLKTFIHAIVNIKFYWDFLNNHRHYKNYFCHNFLINWLWYSNILTFLDFLIDFYNCFVIKLLQFKFMKFFNWKQIKVRHFYYLFEYKIEIYWIYACNYIEFILIMSFYIKLISNWYKSSDIFYFLIDIIIILNPVTLNPMNHMIDD